MPAGLREHMKDKKGDEDESDDDKDNKDEKKDDDKMEKNDMDESTVKSAGYDPNAARDHFDDVEKGYGKGEDGASHRGQPSLGIVGEGISAPKPNFGAGGKGNQTVIKTDDFINMESLSPSQIEEAYEVYKAAAKEQHLKTDLGNYFETRLQKEISEESNEKARQEYDSREPLADLQKAVLALGGLILSPLGSLKPSRSPHRLQSMFLFLTRANWQP